MMKIVTVKMVKLAVGLFLISYSPFAFSATAIPTIKLAAEAAFKDSFEKWSAEAGGCDKINSFKSPYATRGAVEMVLVCLAFKAMKYDVKIEVVEVPNAKRGNEQAAAGNVTMPGESDWENEFISPADLYLTDAVIEKGEFEKAIMMTPEGLAKHPVHSLADLRKLKAVMPKTWAVDWNTLKSLSIETIDAPQKESIFKMLQAGRGDFTLLEFSNEKDMGVSFVGVKLVPVPGLKVALEGVRKMAVSKKYPNSTEIFDRLNQGIKLLRKNGTIRRAWAESGFMNSRAKSWKLVN